MREQSLLGQQIGNYQQIRMLGRGGFAEVYLEEHLHPGTHAAIKVLHTALIGDKEIEYFRSAARMVALYFVAWSLDGTRILSGGNERTVTVWQAA